MRSQKRSRGPRNVRPNAAKAAATPSASSLISRSAREKRGEDQARDEKKAERGVKLRGLEIDHRDRALLTGGPQLRRADLPHEKRQREHREQRPGRQEPQHDA